MIQRVSIIVPMRNEEARVEELVADIAAQAFVGEIELLVADGCSSDRSVERLRAATERHQVSLTLIENPERLIPHALNACIRRAQGELIVRMDCHSRYPADYVARCIATIEKTGAWNVGGRTFPVGESRMQRAAACATDSPFGGIGWTRLGTAGDPIDADTVFPGAFRSYVFDRIGLFDESLPRNEDEDLNFRIRRAGGRVVLDPTIRVSYIPRDSATALFRQYMGYGRGKVDVMWKHHRPMTIRSVIPLGFVGSLAILGFLSIPSRRARRLLKTELAVYGSCMVGFAVHSIDRRSEPLPILPSVAVAFPLMHLGYGVGALAGICGRAIGRRSTAR